MGVPVVTLAWQRPVSRQSLAILNSLGLAELVTFTAQDYIEVCQQLSERTEWLTQLRATLRQRMRQSDLMNALQMAQTMETVYADLVSDRVQKRFGGAKTGSTQTPTMR